MIDPDKVMGGYCSKQQMICYLNAFEEVKRLREEVSSVIRCMLAESEESPSWGATVHAYIKDLQKVIE